MWPPKSVVLHLPGAVLRQESLRIISCLYRPVVPQIGGARRYGLLLASSYGRPGSPWASDLLGHLRLPWTMLEPQSVHDGWQTVGGTSPSS